LRADRRALTQLLLVRDHGPPDAYLAAGFVRNRVWDAYYNPFKNVPEADVDVVYFCKENVSKSRDTVFESNLRTLDPSTNWQIRNQAHMHDYGGHEPFCSLAHALEHWSETATAVGVRLDQNGSMQFIAPFGLNDLSAHILRITPVMKATDAKGFEFRIRKKNWLQRWPGVKVVR